MQSSHLGSSAYPSTPLRRHNFCPCTRSCSLSPGLLQFPSLWYICLFDSFLATHTKQTKLAKLVLLNPTLNSTDRLKKLHWLPIHNRIIFKITLVTYRTLATSNPSYLHHLILRRHASSLRSSYTIQLHQQVHKSTLVNRGFSYAFPAVWNALPPQVRAQPSLELFKRHLKTHLFRTPNRKLMKTPSASDTMQMAHFKLTIIIIIIIIIIVVVVVIVIIIIITILPLYVVVVVNRIEIRRTTWPTQNIYVSLLGKGPCQFGNMDWSDILLKYIISTIHPLRERQEIICQHFSIIC